MQVSAKIKNEQLPHRYEENKETRKLKNKLWLWGRDRGWLCVSGAVSTLFVYSLSLPSLHHLDYYNNIIILYYIFSTACKYWDVLILNNYATLQLKCLNGRQVGVLRTNNSWAFHLSIMEVSEGESGVGWSAKGEGTGDWGGRGAVVLPSSCTH